MTQALLAAPSGAIERVPVVAPPAAHPRAALLKYRWPLIAAVIASLLLVGLLVRWWLGPQLSAGVVLRRDFVQTLVASGHVESPHRIDVGAQITGTVLSVPVTEGQVVEAGATLVELESGELNAAGREADAAVLQAQARLRQLREVQAPVAEQTLRQAEATRDQARAALTRAQQLFDRGFVARAALDDAREAAARADAEVRAGTQTVRDDRRHRQRPRARGSRCRRRQGQRRGGRRPQRLHGDQRSDRGHADRPECRSRGRGAAGQGAADLVAARPHATGDRDRREEPGPAGDGPEGTRVRRCLSSAAVPRDAGIHQFRSECLDRRGAGQARRAIAARRPEAGHDGLCRHRGCPATAGAADTAWHRARCRWKVILGTYASKTIAPCGDPCGSACAAAATPRSSRGLARETCWFRPMRTWHPEREFAWRRRQRRRRVRTSRCSNRGSRSNGSSRSASCVRVGCRRSSSSPAWRSASR